MEMSGRIARQILLLSLLVLIVSMLIFPKRYGTELPEAPLINVVYELAFYGLLVHLLNRRLSPMQLISSAGLCMIYRFALGAMTGLLISLMYQWQVKIAVLAGMGSYLPAMLLHIVATPFILLPVIKGLHTPRPRAVAPPSSKPTNQSSSSGPTSVSVSREKGFSQSTASRPVEEEFTMKMSGSSSPATGINEGNAFDRATRYIGEDGSVLMAAVVDNEGLLLGNFSRRGVESEDWAPFALALLEKNGQVVSRLQCEPPEKIDMLFEDKKIVVAREKAYSLMVVADRAMDDVLNIRINQGLEMIRKYVSERYSQKLIGNMEKSYV